MSLMINHVFDLLRMMRRKQRTFVGTWVAIARVSILPDMYWVIFLYDLFTHCATPLVNKVGPDEYSNSPLPMISLRVSMEPVSDTILEKLCGLLNTQTNDWLGFGVVAQK